MSILPTVKANGSVVTPTILQMEAVECGAAALAMIFAYHRHYIPLEKVRSHCNVTRDGTKAINMVKTARQYGMTSKGLKVDLDYLEEVPLPAILFWNFNHFVVYEGKKGDDYMLNDPASGRRVVSMEVFDGSFTGIILTFEPGEEFKQTGGPPGISDALKPRLMKVKNALVFAIITGIVLAVPGILIPGFLKEFIDRVLIEARVGWLLPLTWLLAGTVLLQCVATWLQTRYLARLQSQLSVATSCEFIWHVLRLPMSFFSQRSSGDISSRIRSNDTVANMLSGQLAQNLLAMLNVFFFIAVMLAYDVTLTFAAIGVVLFNALLLVYTNRRRVEESRKVQQEIGKQYGELSSGLQSIDNLKATGRESDFFIKWAGFNAKAVDAQQHLSFIANAMNAAPAFLKNFIVQLLTLGFGGYQVMKGQLTIGELVAFQTLVANFVTPVNQLVNMGGQLQIIQADLSRLDDVLLFEEDQSFKLSKEESADDDCTRLSGALVLKGVTFGFNVHQDPLIKCFELNLRPGGRVALVGATGSGKSTIAKLVSGVYQPWEGQVLLDGKDMYSYSRKERAASIASINQDVYVFEGTIRDNLKMWNPAISDAEMIQAAKDAAIHDIITDRPRGYDSVLEEGGKNLSGGQLQRIEIATALTRNPSLLIMDEATSALDSETEHQIDAAIRRRGCTCIIIAHRLSTIRDADEIIYLDGGVVVERGAHDELMVLKGRYYSLVTKS